MDVHKGHQNVTLFIQGRKRKNKSHFRAESRDFAGASVRLHFQRLDRTFFPVDNGWSVGIVISFRPVDAPL